MRYGTDFKRTQIAKIHIAKKELGMEDDDYRALLDRATGKTSCSAMDMSELTAVLEEFKKLGFKGQAKTGVKASSPKDSPQARKIRAMWVTLHKMGAVNDGSEAALTMFVKKLTGIDQLEWLGSADADKVIKSLRGWITRAGGDPNGY